MEMKIVREENNSGNRTRIYKCGCVATSGAGAYGTYGSAWAWDRCPEHRDDLLGDISKAATNNT